MLISTTFLVCVIIKCHRFIAHLWHLQHLLCDKDKRLKDLLLTDFTASWFWSFALKIINFLMWNGEISQQFPKWLVLTWEATELTSCEMCVSEAQIAIQADIYSQLSQPDLWGRMSAKSGNLVINWPDRSHVFHCHTCWRFLQAVFFPRGRQICAIDRSIMYLGYGYQWMYYTGLVGGPDFLSGVLPWLRAFQTRLSHWVID